MWSVADLLTLAFPSLRSHHPWRYYIFISTLAGKVSIFANGEGQARPGIGLQSGADDPGPPSFGGSFVTSWSKSGGKYVGHRRQRAEEEPWTSFLEAPLPGFVEQRGGLLSARDHRGQPNQDVRVSNLDVVFLIVDSCFFFLFLF